MKIRGKSKINLESRRTMRPPQPFSSSIRRVGDLTMNVYRQFVISLDEEKKELTTHETVPGSEQLSIFRTE